MPEKLVFLPFSHSVVCFDSLILARLIAQEDLFLRYIFFFFDRLSVIMVLNLCLTLLPLSTLNCAFYLLSGPNQNSCPALPGSWAVSLCYQALAVC